MLTRSPGRMTPRVVMASVWGMSMTENASGQTSTRVRLTPSTAIEPLETRSGVQLGSIPKARNSHSPSWRRSRRTAVGVDMTLDEMPSQAVADLQRPLEVDAIAGLRVSQVGAGQGLGPGLDLEVVRRGGDDRQAAAVDRHALAEFQRLAAGQARPDDRQAPAGVLLDNPLDPAQSFDQSREHVQAPRLLVSTAVGRQLLPEGRQPITPAPARLTLSMVARWEAG